MEEAGIAERPAEAITATEGTALDPFPSSLEHLSEEDKKRWHETYPFPRDLDHLSEDDKKRWFRWGEVAGLEILKVNVKLLPPMEEDTSPAVFHTKTSTYEKPKLEQDRTLVFEEDF